MGFQNPILAGETLVRSGIKSENFVSRTQPTPAGWRISRDGDAEFNTLHARGDVSGGAASFSSVSASDSFIYRGTELQTTLDTMPKGIKVFGQIAAAARTITTTGVFLIETSLVMEPNRAYRIYNRPFRITGSNIGTNIIFQLFYTTDNTNPQTTSSGVFYGETLATWPSEYESLASSTVIFSNAFAGYFRVALFASVHEAGETGTFQFDPIDLYVEDIGPQPPNYSIDRYAGFTTIKQLKNLEVTCNASKAYDDLDNGYSYTGISITGSYLSTADKTWCWFPAGAFDDLIGVPIADITQLDIYYYVAVGETPPISVSFGHHNHATVAPSIEPAGGTYNVHVYSNWPEEAGYWVPIPSFEAIMSAGTFKGVILGAPSGIVQSQHSGIGYTTSDLKIRATYYK